MNEFAAGVPITYVRDPSVSGGTVAVAGGAVALAAGGTVAVTDTGKPLLVYSMGGTVNTTVSFSGTVTADIGQMQLKDGNGNLAVMPPAQNSKIGATTAMVVQHIDASGRSLDAAAIEFNGSQANSHLLSIDASALQTVTSVEAQALTLDTMAGTVATAAFQSVGNMLLTAVHNSQGTQATSAAQQTGNAALTVMLNNQGTQATTALALEATQQTGNAILTAIMNYQGTQATDVGVAALISSLSGSAATAPNQVASNVNGSISNALLSSIVTLLNGTVPLGSYTLFNAVTGTGASASVDVSFFTQHTIQHVVSGGTVNVQLRTSLDGVHWHIEEVSRDSELFTLSGRTKYISANYVNGNGATLTTLLLSGVN